MFRKRKAQQEMEEISRMLERVLNGECIQPGEIGYEDTLPAKIRYQIRRISEKNQGVEARITRERDETKALIGEIAHQMRNPLAGVESYTQLLEGEISGEPGRTYLCALEQSEQRLHFLTESFIKMARLEQQMIQIKKTTDALADTIFSAVLLVQKAAEEKQMEVEVTGAEETKVWHDEMYTRIVVSDDGIGIPEGEENRIFQRFYRGSRVTGEPGFGLGLYISREIVTLHGGFMKAKIKEQGLEVAIFLPV